MGVFERKEREKRHRSDSIINAAEKVFFAKGIENATMDDVAQKAELSKGTLYLYFQSKEDLCVAINIRGVRVLNELFTKAVQSETLGINKVRAIGQANFEFNEQYPHYVQVLTYYENLKIDMDNATENLKQCMLEGEYIMNILMDAIQCGVKDKSIRKDIDPLKTAFLLWSFSSGIINVVSQKDRMLEQCGIQTEDFMNYFYEFIYHSLKA